ncbi:MAG: YciI family protein [Myxococcota bacterium]
MMLILETPEDFEHRKQQGPAAAEYWAAWRAYMTAVDEKIVGGSALGGSETATTIRVREGARQIQDGPFTESKEALGGYMVFEVETMDEAMELAAACPAASTGAVELRPLLENPQ